MTTQLNFGRDLQGYNAYAPDPSTNAWKATLTNGDVTSITVPSNYPVWIAAFSIQGGADVWVDFSGTAADVPASNLLVASTAVLNPGQRQVYAGDTISVITANTTADISIELYANSYS